MSRHRRGEVGIEEREYEKETDGLESKETG